MPKGNVKASGPGEWSVKWPNRKIGPWKLTIEYGLVGGRTRPVALHIVPTGRRAEALTATQLRKLSWSSLSQEGIEALSADLLDQLASIEEDTSLPDWVGGQVHHRLEQASTRARSVGRPPKPIEELREVARRYEKYVRRGFRDPTRRLAEDFHVERATVSGWLTMCRDHKLLARTTRGRLSEPKRG